MQRKATYGLLLALLLYSGRLMAQHVADTIHLKAVEYVYKKKPLGQGLKHNTLDSMSLATEGATSLADVLSRYTPIFIKSYGPGNLSTISFRGTTPNHTKVYWNGIPINSPMLGQIDMNLVPVFLLDGAQLDYGGASMEAGSGGIGGALELSSRLSGQKNITLVQGIGSFGASKTCLGGSYSKGRFYGSTKVYDEQAKNDFPYTDLYGQSTRLVNANFLQYGLMQQLGYRLNEHATLEGTIWYQMSQRAVPPLMVSSSNDEHQQDESLRSLVQYKRQYNRSLLSISANYDKEYLIYEIRKSDYRSSSYFDTYGLQSSHKLQISRKLSAEQAVQLFYNHAYVPDYDSARTQMKVSVLSRWEWQASKSLNLGLMLRPEWVTLHSPVLAWLGSFSIHPREKDKIELYGNGGKNYNFPTLNDLYWKPGGNPLLKPEADWVTEAGTHIQLWKRTPVEVGATASLYSNWINDYIQWQPGQGGNWQSDNIAKVWARGLETSLQAVYTHAYHRIALHVSYAYTRSENTSLAIPRQLIYVPVHTAQAWLRWEWKRYWLQPEYTFTGERPVPASSLPSFALVNISAARRWQWKTLGGFIQFSLNNLFNTPYQVMALRPMPGRNYLVSLRINWDYAHEK